MNCRHCDKALEHVFLDLGFAPPSNALLSEADLKKPERYFPLRLRVCSHCWLVQTEDYAAADELFTPDYPYFSSVSQGWQDHSAAYARMIIERLDLGTKSFVVEAGANDGYLLRHFSAAGIPCLGIEPTASTAAAAEKRGIPVLREFFGRRVADRLAAEGRQADLLIGNNVYAHVPDINNFTAGLRAALKPGGTITLEFPHLLRLIDGVQFDTVYHEHFSYLSLSTVTRIFEAAGLRVWDVQELTTHGGSLRIYGCHARDNRPSTAAVAGLLAEEERRGLRRLATYEAFQGRVDRLKNDFLRYLLEQNRFGRTIAGYGAAAKANTLLNYAGVRPDLLPYVCDAAPSKQGKFMPGSHIPILSPGALRERKPDIVLILVWNLVEEVISQHDYVRGWGGQFTTPTASSLSTHGSTADFARQ